METATENLKYEGRISIENVGVVGGLLTCLGLIIYFMIMKSINLMQSEIAWSMNTLILGAGIMLTYRYYRTKTQLTVEYLPGLLLGIITTATCVILFSLFMYFWLSGVDQSILEFLKVNSVFMGGERISPFKAGASVFIEGGCSGLLISYMLMQYYKSGFRRKTGEKLQKG